jgi:hypothetical protein
MNTERGSSLVETIVLGLLFMAPLLWGLGVLAELHRTALASTAAVREAGDQAAASATAAEARAAIESAVAEALSDHGLDPHLADVRLTSGASLERGMLVEISLTYPVRVFSLAGASTPAINVTAHHVTTVEPYASRAD